MLMTIIISIFVGAIIGGLARMFMPGNQNIGWVPTILLGILGSSIGSWLVNTLFGYNNANGGIGWIGIAAGVAVAAALIAIYIAVTKKGSHGRTAV